MNIKNILTQKNKFPLTPFRLAFLNLIRRKSSTIIALISMTVAVASAGILLKLYILTNNRFATIAKGGDVIVGAKAGEISILLSSLNLEGKYPDFLPYNLFETLRNQKTVYFEDRTKSKPSYIELVIPFVYFGKYKQYRLIGTDESFLNRPTNEDSVQISEGRWANNLAEVNLGAEVAKKENLLLGDVINVVSWTKNTGQDNEISSDSFRFDLKVVGIYSKTNSAWDRGIYSNLKQAQLVLSQSDLSKSSIWKSKILHYFLIYVNPSGLEQLSSLINRRTVGQIIKVSEEKKHLLELTGTGMQLLLIINLLIILLGGLSITAVMTTKFDSMNVQFAILRALGFTQNEIIKWAIWEGLLLGGISSLLGGILDSILFLVLRTGLGSILPDMSVMPSPFYLSLPVWFVAIMSTMLAVLLPMIKMQKQNIHLALKG